MHMQIDIVNQQNEKVGSLDLRDEVFGGRVKTDLIHESVVHANAAERRGTHKTKTRGLVSGTGKKPWRQKGTGRAQVGEARNPLWRKGGTVFGPQPRSYDYRLTRKVQKGALRAALTQKLRDGQVIVVDALSVSEIKTRAAAEMLKRIGVEGKVLLVDVKPEDKLSIGAQHRGRAAAAEQPHQRPRRDEHAARGADPCGAREAAGRFGVARREKVA